MPVQVSFPGVYIQEVSSGVHTITSVATSIAAFIDFFKQGPMNKATEVLGMADFERVFGGLDDRSEASYAVAQFFLNGGGRTYVVRVASTGAGLAKARVDLRGDDSPLSAVVLTAEAVSEGIWGNDLRVDVDYNTIDPDNFFNLRVRRYDTKDKRKVVASETFLNLSMDSTHPRYVKAVVDEESSLVTITVPASAGTPSRPTPTGTLGDQIPALSQLTLDGMSGKKFGVALGTHAAIGATLETWSAGAVKSLGDLRSKLERAIQVASASTAAPAPWLVGVTVELGGKTRDQLRLLSNRLGDSYDPKETLVVSDSGAPQVATLLKLLSASALENVQEYPLGLGTGVNVAGLKGGAAGTDGGKPGAAEILGVNPNEGMRSLDLVDLFNILCIPRAAELSDSEMDAVVSGAIKYCEDRRAFFLLDVPKAKSNLDDIRDWVDAKGTWRHRNAAVYFPRPSIPDPKNDFRPRSVGASGTIAGVFARTDVARGVWKAPAGIEATLAGVSKLDPKLTDGQNGTLNPLGINCLRVFPIYGNLSWGTRTLVGADEMTSEWKYVPVRRLALMLEESLFRGTKWVVFEPNDEPLWAKIRLNVGAYMTSLFRQGAFQGVTPKEAFFVKCDAETTTQDDRNKGIVNILVGFAPLKPAEFVVISIQQMPGAL